MIILHKTWLLIVFYVCLFFSFFLLAEDESLVAKETLTTRQTEYTAALGTDNEQAAFNILTTAKVALNDTDEMFHSWMTSQALCIVLFKIPHPDHCTEDIGDYANILRTIKVLVWFN